MYNQVNLIPNVQSSICIPISSPMYNQVISSPISGRRSHCVLITSMTTIPYSDKQGQGYSQGGPHQRTVIGQESLLTHSLAPYHRKVALAARLIISLETLPSALDSAAHNQLRKPSALDIKMGHWQLPDPSPGQLVTAIIVIPLRLMRAVLVA